MVSNKQRKTRGTILGLALAAMLAFGALSAGAAQAAPQWSINGKAFAGTETFESKSAIPVTIGFWGMKYECDQSAKGTMVGGTGEGEAYVTFSNCKSASPTCQLEPIATQKLRIDLVEVNGFVSEKFTGASADELIGYLRLRGGSCSALGDWPLKGSFAAWFNVKQTLPSAKPSLRFSGMPSGAAMNTSGASPVTLAGDTQQWLTGANAGYTWWWVP